MKYKVTAPIPTSQILEIELQITCLAGEQIKLQLPAWRPGRYEIANYAQFVKNLRLESPEGPLPVKKLTKDLWAFQASQEGKYIIKYAYHAAQMDAGGSWVDPGQIYINFINLAFAIKGKEEEGIGVSLDLPEDYQVACALPHPKRHELAAQNYQELVDSPLIASNKLKHHSYTVKNSQFHLWIAGEVFFDIKTVLEGFVNFTLEQINHFGEFPAKDYHFLIHLLPFRHYHGVEHRYSTVITLGPDKELAKPEAMDKLMGVCSHELYHFWNVCRIRPKAIQPYDFVKEAYLTEGMIAEGVTTFMGDFYLLKSGYYTIDKYLNILEKLFQRGFENQGWANQSIVESSWDLWLDGYKMGVPDKKVSIYSYGALLTLTLDLLLMKENHRMHQVMRIMWEKYNEIGYELEDFKQIVLELAKEKEIFHSFFDRFVWGREDLFPFLAIQMKSIGLEVKKVSTDNRLESEFGIKTDKNGKIIQLHPLAPSYEKLMLGDKVLSYAYKENTLTLNISRWEVSHEFNIENTNTLFFANYAIKPTGSGEAFNKFVNN